MHFFVQRGFSSHWNVGPSQRESNSTGAQRIADNREARGSVRRTEVKVVEIVGGVDASEGGANGKKSREGKQSRHRHHALSRYGCYILLPGIFLPTGVTGKKSFTMTMS